jgi:hypothetical protein
MTRLRATLLSLAFLAATGPFPLAAQTDVAPTEYQVKAVFLYNFAKFVDWPPESFRPGDATFVVGMVGSDPIEDDLKGILEGKTVKDRKITFRRIQDIADSRECQILYVAASEKKNLDRILQAVAGRPILIVSDMKNFIQLGGMIGFKLDDSKVRFDINQTVSSAANLKISAQLLKVAQVVATSPARQ